MSDLDRPTLKALRPALVQMFPQNALYKYTSHSGDKEGDSEFNGAWGLVFWGEVISDK